MRSLFHAAILAALLLIPGLSQQVSAQTIRIDLGTAAPDGSAYHQVLSRMKSEWAKASGGKVDLRIFPGGVLGDEAAMLEKASGGRIQAVAISGVGLARLSKGVSALQIPMLVDSYAQLDRIRAGLEPRLEKEINDKGYVVLNWSDVGWVYFFTTRPAKTPADLKAMRLFIVAGDPDTEALYRQMGFNPVPLGVNDLFTSLQTGLIDAFDVPPLFALADQSFGLARYMIDLKWAPIVGATIIHRSAWERIPAALRPELLRIARASGNELRAKIRADGDAAIAKMQEYKLTVVKLQPNEIKQWRSMAEAVYPKLRGGLIPSDHFDEAVRLSREPR